MTHFNPRSHERSDAALTALIILIVTISIHAPTRGATKQTIQETGCSSISIHAPTRGATNVRHKRPDRIQISIHAPTRGATHIFGHTSPAIDFNPRSHERSDLMRSVTQKCINCISIHAPTRGATGARHSSF